MRVSVRRERDQHRVRNGARQAGAAGVAVSAGVSAGAIAKRVMYWDGGVAETGSICVGCCVWRVLVSLKSLRYPHRFRPDSPDWGVFDEPVIPPMSPKRARRTTRKEPRWLARTHRTLPLDRP